jgi:phosphoserine phosphatase RsbU/P
MMPSAPASSDDITDVLAAALAGLPPENIAAEEVIVRQGETSEYAYFVTKGTVSIYADTPYGAVPLASLTGPKLVGEISALAGIPRTASIKAVTELKLHRLNQETLLDLGRRNPDLLLQVVGNLGRQLDAVNQTVGLYTNALAALGRREFDTRILDELAHPPPALAAFASTFRHFAAEITAKRQQEDELAGAAIIQQSFLPKPDALAAARRDMDIAARMRPARDVGGDFYDFFMLDADHAAVAIGDVCGKGIAASLFMAVTVTALRTAAHELKDVGATVARANAVLCRDNAANMFATVFYGVLNLRTGVLEYCNCGHNGPFHLLASGETKSLPGTGLPLALFANRQAAVAGTILHPGDVLVLYTDGVTEAMNAAQEEYGDDALNAVLQGMRDMAPSDIVSKIFSGVDGFAAGAEQADDITCIVIRR